MFAELDVLVHVETLDVESLPLWQKELYDMPEGTGIKGGIARKVLKVKAGLSKNHPTLESELNGEGDIDILIAIPKVTPKERLYLRKSFSGMKMGSFVVEAKDIEVSDSLEHYFMSRDITMNEVLIFRSLEEQWLLFYTEDAWRDVLGGIIRPSIHCQGNPFGELWKYDENYNHIIAPKPLTRCIIRWMKGHGSSYAIDEGSWKYYRRNGLPDTDLFRVLRTFVDSDEQYYRCVAHLIDLGLLPGDVDPDLLWGKVFESVNRLLARHRRRLTMKEPNAEDIEAWIIRKEREFQDRIFRRKSLAASGKKIEPDMRDLIILPKGMDNYPSYFVHD